MTDRYKYEYHGFLKDLEAFEKEGVLQEELSAAAEKVSAIFAKYRRMEEELHILEGELADEERWLTALNKYIKDRGIAS